MNRPFRAAWSRAEPALGDPKAALLDVPMSAPSTSHPSPASDRSTEEARAGRPGPEAATRSASNRATLVAFLHLAALSGFALAQPLFDLLGRNPEFFATRGSGAGDVLALGLALVLIPPTLLILLELAAGALDARLRVGQHLAFVALLALLLVLQALKRIAPAGGVVLVAIAVVLAVAAAVVYARLAGVRSFLTVLAPAPLVFLVLFVVVSPVSALILGGTDEARAQPVQAQAPVVMVVFDELPLASLLDARGRIDAKRYPSFATLARDATFFRNATTLSDQTTKAVPAILGGQRPDAGGERSSVSGALPIARDYPNNVFTLFGKRYRRNVSEEVTTLCPEDLCRAERAPVVARARSLASDIGLVYLHVALPDEVTERLPSVSDTWGEFNGQEAAAGEGAAREQIGAATKGGRAERFDEFLAGVGGGAGPSLDFKHSLLPHVPWQYLPSGRRYRPSSREPVPGLVPPSGTEPFRDDFLVEQAYQRHLLQVGFADRLLGRLLARLRAERRYDRAAIVVVADHGVSFRRGLDRRGASEANFEDIAAVPLLVKAPDQRRGRVDDAYVRTDEVLPTLANVLGVRLPWRTDGRSGFSRSAERRSSVEIQRRDGGRVRLSVDRFERRQAGAVARKAALFGAGLYAIGPNARLIGRPVSRLPRARASGLRADVTGPDPVRTYDPRSGQAPTHVAGALTGGRPAAGGRDLAIAVNGRIAAVARSYRSRRRPAEYFSALVPESALRPGPNSVELFAVVRERSGRLRLASLQRG